MYCPECGRECERGQVYGRMKHMYTVLDWWPEEESNYPFYKEPVKLNLQGEGYYCKECMIVFAIFDEEFDRNIRNY